MTSVTLFPEPSIPHTAPLGWAEPNVNFYLKSTRPEAISARRWINEAYDRFPDPSGGLATRLRSTDDVQNASALDELLVHDLLTRRGDVKHEEGGRGPDFRLYQDGEYVAAVEVCSLFENRRWTDIQQQHARLADVVNRQIPLSDWFIHFEVIRHERQPSTNRVVAWLKQQLAALPEGTDIVPEITYATDEVELRFWFVRRTRSTAPHPTDRVVGSGQIVGGVVDSYLRVRSALEKKIQKRYDTRGMPFAIVVGIWDPMCNTDQLEDALLGNEQVIVRSGDVIRAGNGFFGVDRRSPTGKHREVSAVIALHGWRPWAGDSGTMVRFENPYASVPFPDDLLPAERVL